jgi:AcrR family transcriptional regulator
MTTPSIELLTDLRRRRVADEATTPELAAEVGMSVHLLNYYWRTRGLVESMPYRTPWTQAEVQQLYARWIARESLNELAASSGRSKSAIWSAFDRAGLSLPDYDVRGGYRVRDSARRISQRAAVYGVQMRREGWTYPRIHTEVVARFGYPFGLKSLERTIRRYARVHLEESSPVRAAVLGGGR